MKGWSLEEKIRKGKWKRAHSKTEDMIQPLWLLECEYYLQSYDHVRLRQERCCEIVLMGTDGRCFTYTQKPGQRVKPQDIITPCFMLLV